MAPRIGGRYDARMSTYTLNLFTDERPGTTIRMGLGKLAFDAGHDQAAVEMVQKLYPERLADPGHAVLTAEDGRTVWEKPIA